MTDEPPESEWSRSLAIALESQQERALELLRSQETEERPAVVYHYTTPGPFQKMLETGTIWASHALYLNDPSELVHINKVLLRAARELVSRARTHTARQVLEIVSGDKWLNRDEYRSVYVACFSERRDRLSQWRAYTDDGLGFAIGIDTGAHFKVKGQEDLEAQLLRVEYNEDKQFEVAHAVLGRIVETLNEAGDGPNRYEDERATFNAMLTVVLLVLPMGLRLKNRGFEEEEEWRLVVTDEMGWPTGGYVRYRPSRFGFTPYVELTAGEKLPLKCVVRGPRMQTFQARHSSNDLLLAHRYNILSKDRPGYVELVDAVATYRGHSHGG